MFDANMRYLPVGTRFFCYTHGQDEPNRPSYLKARQVYLCQHLGGDKDNPTIKITLPSKQNLYWRESDVPDNLLLTFEGTATGESFIDELSRKEALAILGGKWDEA